MACRSSPAAAATTAPATATATASPVATTSSTLTASGPPRTPEGFRAWYAHPPTTGKPWQYGAWIAATAVAHVRDTKLGAAVTRTLLLAAPIGLDGRPDTARAANIDPNALATSPAAGARFRPVPDVLFKKAGQDAALKALREHVYRTLEITIDVHEALGLVRADDESREAFAERCRAEAVKQAAAAEQQVAQKAAPKIARWNDRMQTIQAKLAGADAELNSLPGAMTTAIIGFAVGRGTVRQTESQRGKVITRIEKLRGEWTEAETALRAAVAERDAEINGLRYASTRTAAAIETRNLKPKKTDVEITGLAIAWGVE